MKEMKSGREKIAYKVCSVAAVLLFHVLILAAILYFSLFRAGFLYQECERYQVASRLKISGEELHQVTDRLISYVKGYSEDLDIVVTMNGSSREFFNERDKQHVEDVAVMLEQFRAAAGVAVFILLILLGFLLYRRKLSLLCKTYLFSWLLWILLSVVVGVWLLADLTGFINTFHRLLFRNNNWVLNPVNDLLIWLFPEELFRDGAILLASWFAGLHLAVTVAAICYRVRHDGIFTH